MCPQPSGLTMEQHQAIGMSRRHLEAKLAALGTEPHQVLIFGFLVVTTGLAERMTAVLAAVDELAGTDAWGVLGGDSVAVVLHGTDRAEARAVADRVLAVVAGDGAVPLLVTIQEAGPSSPDLLWEAARLADARRQVAWHQMFSEELAHFRTTSELAEYIVHAATSTHGADRALVTVDGRRWGGDRSEEPRGSIPLYRADGTVFGNVEWWGGPPETAIPGYVAVATAEFSSAFLRTKELELADNAVHTDAMTGLLTRAGLQSALRRVTDTSVIAFVDIDKFKAINDELGHAVGDAAIGLTASVLSDRRRNSDLISRWAGDEFVVVLPGASLDHAATSLGELARSSRLNVEGRQFTLSIGVAALAHGAELREAVARADEAMYHSKRAGGGCLTVAGVPSGNDER